MVNPTQTAERVIVALDYPDETAARQLLDRLDGIPVWMKVGMELFYAAGPAFVVYLKERGFHVFLDLKLHDIPNTVKGGSASVTRLGVDMFNLHAAGGRAMLEAGLEGVDKALAPGQKRPLVIGVTQLTSTSQSVLNDEIGIPGAIDDAVLRYAALTKQAGLDGVVASAREVTGLKAANGAGFVTVTPGIRPAGSAIGDQSRVMTPKEALAIGTDYMVIGRPITAAPDPREALEHILEEMSEA
ncbi:MAG: orotidine-5'-phosphate decarboxylase [Paenibacillaceae bacterium]|nr:orotidine-5'-phosphate decarboxylase [Paenibacillaceae bacterium]